MRKSLVAALFVFLIALVSIDSLSAQKTSLYSRLGGKKTLQALVDQFVTSLLADSRINKFFSDVAKDPKRLGILKSNLVDQLCQAAGGPCKYKGKDMKTAHKGMGITDADFDALIEDLVRALDKVSVGASEKNELLGAFGNMRSDVVGGGLEVACQEGQCLVPHCKGKCGNKSCTCSKK